ncbi:MAG TPA: hypothetical protein VLB69_14625 [Rudaea sp.]|nr:hypothetical protein [Rudaea sp.]
MHAEIFACAGNSIRVFADGASGADAPLRVIAGATSGVNECYDVAYDAVHDEIVVAHGPVSVFAGGDSGDVAPLRQIFGDMTGMGFAVSIAIDTQGDELVVGSTGPMISTFTRTANGNVAPTRSFSPSGTLDTPVALYVDRIRDEVAASRYTAPGLVYYFDRLSGAQIGSHNPVSAPAPRGLYIEAASGSLVIATSSGVETFDHSGALVTYFAYPTLNSPWGLAVLGTGETWVGNQSSTSTDPDPLLLFPAGAAGAGATLSRQINTGAPGSSNLYGIASSRAANCGAGHVACDSVFRGSFDVVYR